MQEPEEEEESTRWWNKTPNKNSQTTQDISPEIRHWTGLAIWATMLLLDTFANATINALLYGLPACLMLGGRVTDAASELATSIAKGRFERRR